MNRRTTRHRLTRLGIQVMLIGMFGILGGSLNGLNLLIVVAGICIGATFVQWRTSRAFIDVLRIDRRLPAEVFAGKPVRIRYQISNEHPLVPVWLIRIEDTLTRVNQRKRRRSSDQRLTEQRPLSKQWFPLRIGKIKAARSMPVDRTKTFTGVGLLLPRRATSAHFDITFPRRGSYRLGRWLVSTTAPLALSLAWRESVRRSDTIDVFPKLLPLARNWRRILPTRLGSVSTAAQRQGPADDVFFGLREYRHGDSLKTIHWRTTARLGEPAVRQFEQQRRYDLCLLIDGFDADDHDLAERSISLGATIAVELGAVASSRFLTVVAGQTLEVIPSVASPAGMKRFLQSLARLELTQSVDLRSAIREAATASKQLPDLLVVSPRSQAEAVEGDAKLSESITRWKGRGVVRWLDLSDSSIASKLISNHDRQIEPTTSPIAKPQERNRR